MNIYDNPRQAAPYVAGLFDGEGCICMTRNGPGGTAYNVRAQIAMVDHRVIKLLQDLFGGSITEERVPNRQLVYRWQLRKQEDFKFFCAIIRPYLLIKGKVMDVALRYLKEKKDFGRWNPITEEEIQWRKDLYVEVRELNAVGAAATTKRKDTREGEAIV